MTGLPISFTVHDEPCREDAALVDSGLGSFNEAAAPLHEVRPLGCFARLPSGQVIGGAVGRTWGACCELQQLWVEPGHRRCGIGARLVRELERRAEARGCRTFYLDTFSFQAPALYRSLGYETRLELHGFGPGIVKYTMVRHIGSGDDPMLPPAGPADRQDNAPGAALRLARRSDIAAMHRIRLAVRENQLATAIDEADYVAAIDHPGRGWVIEVAGEIVGFAVGNAGNGNVWALFVAPGHEGFGYGKRLHDALVEWLWSQGRSRLWLTTETGTRAQRFYEAAGWSRVGPAHPGQTMYELTRARWRAGHAGRESR